LVVDNMRGEPVPQLTLNRYQLKDFCDALMAYAVIEPARPAVPDEPEGVERVLTQNHRVAMLTGGGWIVIGNPDDDPDDRGPMTYDWQALWHYHGPLYIYSRGPVIGGE
jgi:hypothetical protein